MKKLLQISILIVCFFLYSSFMSYSKVESFPIKELILNNGKTVQIDDLKGKVILLDFWHRGCLPCIKAMPDLIKLQEKYKEDLIIIGINDFDSQNEVTNYLNYKKANYHSTYKSEKSLSKQLNINTFPTFIIINREGEMIETAIGFDKKHIKKTIKELINTYSL